MFVDIRKTRIYYKDSPKDKYEKKMYSYQISF